MTTMKQTLLTACAASAIALGCVSAASAQNVYGGGSSLAGPAYNNLFGISSILNPGPVFSYQTSGSGTGQNNFFNNHDAANPTWAPIAFGASDAALSSGQLNTWRGGANQANAGNLIEIPTFGTPITIAFNVIGATSNGAIRLTEDQVCGIFSGKLTTWSSVGVTTGIDAIKVAFRNDNSGTSFLLTQHLAAVCSLGGNSNVAFFATQSFASLFGGLSKVPSNFITTASGSGGVQTAIDQTVSSIGYLSPDYTAIAHSSVPKDPFVAAVQNVNDSNYHLPTTTETATALGGLAGPQTLADASNPLNFVPNSGSPASGYPIVGYTTWLVAQCYANPAIGNGIKTFVNDLATIPTFKSVLGASGFVPSSGSVNAAVTTYLSGADNGVTTIQSAAACTGKAGR